MSRDIIRAWAWNFVLSSSAAPQYLAEVSHAAIFMLSMEIFPVLADRKRSRVFPRSWNINLFLVFVLDFSREGVKDV